MIHYTNQGTHHGNYMKIPATGKLINITAIAIQRFAGGKIVETWGMPDMLSMMQQLGVMPPMGQK